MPASVASGEEDEYEVSPIIIDIEDLQNHGINASDIGKLKSHGYHTVAVWHRPNVSQSSLLTTFSRASTQQ